MHVNQIYAGNRFACIFGYHFLQTLPLPAFLLQLATLAQKSMKLVDFINSFS